MSRTFRRYRLSQAMRNVSLGALLFSMAVIFSAQSGAHSVYVFLTAICVYVASGLLKHYAGLVRVDDDGLRTSDPFGAPSYSKWSEVVSADVVDSGPRPPVLRIRSGDGRLTTVESPLSTDEAFIDAVVSAAGPEHPVSQALQREKVGTKDKDR